jgi:3' exoribonuclease, RNase T-like
MTNHLMLDFETLGHQAPHCVVLSLGAVVFNREKYLGEQEWLFNVQEQLDKGRRVSASTIAWWFGDKVTPEAQSVIPLAEKEGKDLVSVMMSFNKFQHDLIGDQTKDIRVWGNGAAFDIAIAESLASMAKIGVTWKFWNQRCYRTLKQMFDIEKNVSRTGVKHSALGDAKFQATCVAEFLQANPEWDK